MATSIAVPATPASALTLRRHTHAPGSETSRARADRQISWLRTYAAERIDPRSMDERRSIPPYIAMDFGLAGLFGPLVEERHGGTTLRLTDHFRVLQQLVAIDTGLGTWVGSSVYLGTRSLSAWGTEELKQQWLPNLAAGRVLGAYAQTEPGAGSDFSALSTRAQPLPCGGFRLNGGKHWIGNGSWAGVMTVIARIAPDRANRSSGVVALAVPADSPGVRAGAEHPSAGLRGMVQTRLDFTDVYVPAHAVLGDGDGRAVALDSMAITRLAVAACAVGAMKRCAQVAHGYAERRLMSGVPLAHRAATRRTLGDLVARIELCQGMLDALAHRYDEVGHLPLEAVISVKVLASEWAADAADALAQILGGRGYDETYLAPRLHRDLRAYRIFEGATEALTDFLGRHSLSHTVRVHTLLRELGGEQSTARLEPALAAVRALGHTTVADGRYNAPVAHAVMWALAQTMAQQSPTPLSPYTSRYAEEQYTAALSVLCDGQPCARTLTTPEELTECIGLYQESIGHVPVSPPEHPVPLDPYLQGRGKAPVGA
ncbi:acyl-CoA dehydrogenase family protein [Kitasatospora cineracea]|uniref:acyl-CoA dehydrogenase family protein n=1 Tax=Kitasatospora cineracea TaxID=88074 RepID=UPI0037B51026